MAVLRNALLFGRFRDYRLASSLLIAVAASFLAYVVRLSDVTHDAFHEMALARVWATTGHFPTEDVFAFTSTVSPVVHHEWGTGVILYWVGERSALGLDGLAWLRLVLIGSLAVLIYRVARNQGAHPYLIAVCAPVMFPLMWVGFANLRAQLFTLVFLVALMGMLQSDSRGRRFWIFPWFAMHVAWLNMHAGFVVGLGYLGFHIAERWLSILYWNDRGQFQCDRCMSFATWRTAWQRYWHHLVVLVMAVLGLRLNPWGWQYVGYLWKAIRMPRPTMLEWQPLWATYQPSIAILAFTLSVILLGYVAKNRRWLRLSGWLFCALAAYMALKHLRHGSLYGTLWLTLMPGWLTPTPLGRTLIAKLQSTRNMAIFAASMVAIACASFAWVHAPLRSTLPSDDPSSVMVYPVQACSFIDKHQLSGNIITPFASGGYVSWRCHPRVRVSIDGRYEVAYQEHVLPMHDRFFEGREGWNDLLHRYPADLILIQRTAPVLDRFIHSEESSAWNVVHEDSAFVLFAKRRFAVTTSESR
ncbi:MAG: hypothetical protein MUF23_14125 [Pirellula sp.]|nr:hypothetical protein [Pirellula sp.]